MKYSKKQIEIVKDIIKEGSCTVACGIDGETCPISIFAKSKEEGCIDTASMLKLAKEFLESVDDSSCKSEDDSSCKLDICKYYFSSCSNKCSLCANSLKDCILNNYISFRPIAGLPLSSVMYRVITEEEFDKLFPLSSKYKTDVKSRWGMRVFVSDSFTEDQWNTTDPGREFLIQDTSLYINKAYVIREVIPSKELLLIKYLVQNGSCLSDGGKFCRGVCDPFCKGKICEACNKQSLFRSKVIRGALLKYYNLDPRSYLPDFTIRNSSSAENKTDSLKEEVSTSITMQITQSTKIKLNLNIDYSNLLSKERFEVKKLRIKLQGER